jgi:hypothetical protein
MLKKGDKKKMSEENVLGHAVSQLIEALHYTPDGRGFDSRWCQWDFFIDILPATLWPLGSTQLLTEMSTSNIYWG